MSKASPHSQQPVMAQGDRGLQAIPQGESVVGNTWSGSLTVPDISNHNLASLGRWVPVQTVREAGSYWPAGWVETEFTNQEQPHRVSKTI